MTKWKKRYEVIKRHEFEARQKIPECALCPHLGVGEPLVDKQARDLSRAKELLAGFLRVLPQVKTSGAYPELNELMVKTTELLRKD